MQVTIYTKPNCPLCDLASTLVHKHGGRRGARVVHVDISTDAELWDAFRDRIPVVEVDGEIIAEGKISEHRIKTVMSGGKLRPRYREMRARLTEQLQVIRRSVHDTEKP